MPDSFEFRHSVVHPTRLHAWPNASSPGFMLGGRFRVLLRLDPAVDCTRDEYRRLSRGHVPPNAVISTVQSALQLGRRRPRNRQGLGLLDFQRTACPHIPRRWHRPKWAHQPLRTSFLKTNIRGGVEDRYRPHQRDGSTYHLTDTYGIKDVTVSSARAFAFTYILKAG